MAKKIRNIQSSKVQDSSTIDNMTYNAAAGATKNLPAGPHLIPLSDGAGGFTTDATTKRTLPSMGRGLAIYNNDTAVHSVTVGDSTVAAQSAGAVQAGTLFVGIPCPPEEWSFVSLAESTVVVTDSNKLLVFLIDDESAIVQETSR